MNKAKRLWIFVTVLFLVGLPFANAQHSGADHQGEGAHRVSDNNQPSSQQLRRMQRAALRGTMGSEMQASAKKAREQGRKFIPNDGQLEKLHKAALKGKLGRAAQKEAKKAQSPKRVQSRKVGHNPSHAGSHHRGKGVKNSSKSSRKPNAGYSRNSFGGHWSAPGGKGVKASSPKSSSRFSGGYSRKSFGGHWGTSHSGTMSRSIRDIAGDNRDMGPLGDHNSRHSTGERAGPEGSHDDHHSGSGHREDRGSVHAD